MEGDSDGENQKAWTTESQTTKQQRGSTDERKWGREGTGLQYRQRLQDLGRSESIGRVDNVYRGLVRQALDEAFKKYAPDQISRHDTQSSRRLGEAQPAAGYRPTICPRDGEANQTLRAASARTYSR